MSVLNVKPGAITVRNTTKREEQSAQIGLTEQNRTQCCARYYLKDSGFILKIQVSISVVSLTYF